MIFQKVNLKVKWLEDLFECEIISLKVYVFAGCTEKQLLFKINHPKYGGDYIYTWSSSPSRGTSFLSKDGKDISDPAPQSISRDLCIWALQNIVTKTPIEIF